MMIASAPFLYSTLAIAQWLEMHSEWLIPFVAVGTLFLSILFPKYLWPAMRWIAERVRDEMRFRQNTQDLTEKLDHIHKEFYPNQGSSFSDRITDQIEEALHHKTESIRDEIQTLDERVSRIEKEETVEALLKRVVEYVNKTHGSKE